MQYRSFLNMLASSLTLVAVATAGYATHRVEVGSGGALAFSPNSTVAAVGDIVEFVFFPKNHSVVQSTFKNPCDSTTGFFSGFMPVASGQGNKTFQVTVNDTKPIWFYCSQAGAGGHCAKGMVGCVNCPTSGNTLDAFAAAAKMTNNMTVTQPASVGGGVIVQNSTAATTSPAGTTTTSAASGSPSSTGTNAAPNLSIAKGTVLSLAAALAYILC